MVYDFLANVKLSVTPGQFELPPHAEERKKYLQGTFPVSNEYEILIDEEPVKSTDKLIEASISGHSINTISYLCSGNTKRIHAIVEKGAPGIPEKLSLNLKFKE